jgi:hypothetical protein
MKIIQVCKFGTLGTSSESASNFRFFPFAADAALGVSSLLSSEESSEDSSFLPK